MNQRSQVRQRTKDSPGNQAGSYDTTPYDESGRGHEVAPAGKRSRTESATTVLPAVDIFEDDAGFTVIADMPGVSKDRLSVRVTGDNLVIEGTAAAPVIGNMELLYGEVQTPHYRRSFTLSRELDPGKIEAKLSDGVLRLTIPKAEEAKPRRIKVTVV
ncbi:MAG: Hsp20/alpha crystallin family protein [Polaromonas sp.]